MKDPCVLFYSQDFLTGTLLMNYEQRGKYITLLCIQQQNGGLTERDMLKVCGEKDEDIWAKFECRDGVFYNKRMEIEANRRKKFVDSRIKNIHKDTHMDSHMEIRNKKYEIGNKKEENRNDLLLKREAKFKSEVFEYLKRYPETMLTKFYDYWTEKNKSQTKMRFELEKVFEISKRLATWARKDNEFNKSISDEITYKELLTRFNKGETDIWEKYELSANKKWKLKIEK